MKLQEALQTKNTRTENDMPTHSTSMNECVDFFFTAGAMRNEEERRIVSKFSKAFNEDPLTAMKLLFWARDVRGGAGERRLARIILRYLANDHKTSLSKNLHLVPFYGRWDDLLTIVETDQEPVATESMKLIGEGLNDEETMGLVAKWMPRPKKSPIANKIRKFFGQSPKQYRKMLKERTDVVENKMCRKEFEKIEFEKVPSLAMARYTNAFERNAPTAFQEYKRKLEEGEAKVNAGAVYPYDVMKSLRDGENTVANKQWESLPNYMKDTEERILPVCDVSGSMTFRSVSGSTSPIDISVSLGIYISERNEGAFKDFFVSFSGDSNLHKLSGSLSDRVRQIKGHGGTNTDIEKVFTNLLRRAKEFGVPQSEMPTMLLIISDMEFDGCDSNWEDPTAHQMMKQKYEDAGYKMPKIVFWNVMSRHDNIPVKFHESGTALVSGFSPSILTSILRGKKFTPEAIMKDTIESERYSYVTY
jgi:hypothetical protein